MALSRYVCPVSALALVGSACSAEPHVALGAQDSTTIDPLSTLSAELVVATVAALPACNGSTAGTTAYVQQGSQLYTCTRGSWLRQPCTVDRAGAVAFVTGEAFLLACSARAWARVELPAGASGPAGDAGPVGVSALVRTGAEASGAACAAGGLRVESGLDANRNGSLDDVEVSSTSYVCNGADGSGGTPAAPVRTTSRAASAQECVSGGHVVSIYQDDDNDSAEDPGEASGAPIVVCNGDPAAANGAAPVVKAYRSVNDEGVFASEGIAGTALVLSASILVPRPGTVVALGSTVAYCSSASVPAELAYGRCATPVGSTTGLVTIVDAASPNQGGNSGESIAVTAMREDADQQLFVSATFNVGAGTTTLNMLGMASDFTPELAETSLYFGASELTLLFFPND